MKRQQPIRVLLVDGDLDFLFAIAKALRKRGFQVLLAATGREALRRLQEHPVDVTVLEVKLPDSDGYQLFGKIRKHHPAVKVIILTGHARVDKIFEMTRRGVSDYLGKPCDVGTLADAIRKAHTGSEQKVAFEATADGPPRDIRVLLVDDESDFVSSTARMLRRRGMDVLVATTARGGLWLTEIYPIDVAVIELKMPTMDGIELLKKIKRTSPLTEVIILTGHGMVDTEIQALKLGAYDHLMKPENIDQLAERISQAAQYKRYSERTLRSRRLA